MFAQITTFRFASATAPKLVKAFREHVLDPLRAVDGFIDAELFTRSRLNKGVAVFYWEEEFDAMRYRDAGSFDQLWASLSDYLAGEPETEGYEPNIVVPQLEPRA